MLLQMGAAVLALAASGPQAAPPTPAPAANQAESGIDVELMVLREVTSDRAKPGEEVKMQVNRPVQLADRVIPAGTPAFGEVVDVKASGMVMTRGAISMRLVRLVVDGREVPVNGEIAARGRGGKNDDLVKVALTAWYSLIARGASGKFKAGELVHGRLPAGFRLP